MTEHQTFILRNEAVRRNALTELLRAPEGYVVTIAPKTRSVDQNGKLHALCQDIANSGMLFNGKPRDMLTWKSLLISAHAVATGTAGEVCPGLEGEFVALRESSARMGVGRAASLILYILAFCDTNKIVLRETRKGGFYDEPELERVA